MQKIGEYLYGKKNGKGKVHYWDYYEGEYYNDKKHGKGKEYYNNGNLKFEGEYYNDKKHGKGKEYFNNGNIKFEGEYFYGMKWTGQGYNSMKELIYELNNGDGYVKLYMN